MLASNAVGTSTPSNVSSATTMLGVTQAPQVPGVGEQVEVDEAGHTGVLPGQEQPHEVAPDEPCAPRHQHPVRGDPPFLLERIGTY